MDIAVIIADRLAHVKGYGIGAGARDDAPLLVLGREAGGG